MKIYVLLLSTIIGLFGAESRGDSPIFSKMDSGFDSPQAAADSFLSNLKNGRSGVRAAVNMLPGEQNRQNNLINEAKESLGERPIETELNSSLGGDRLLSFLKTGQEVKFGGKLVKAFYDLYFEKSPVKKVTFLIMQPTMSGGYYIVDVIVSGKPNLDMLMETGDGSDQK